MAENIPVVIQVGTLPPGVTFPDYQSLVNEIAKTLTAYLPGAYAPMNTGNATPSADNQDRPWARENVDGSPDRIYTFFNGKWVARHPIDPSSSSRQLWVGTLEALRSYDGGDGTTDAPTATTGAMWVEDEDFRDRIPMGVLESTGAVTAVATNAGANTVTLVEANLPAHKHYIASTRELNGANGTTLQASYTVDRQGGQDGTGDREYTLSGSDPASYPATVGQTSSVGSATAVSIVPQVRGCYVIKRSGRTFYTP